MDKLDGTSFAGLFDTTDARSIHILRTAFREAASMTLSTCFAHLYLVFLGVVKHVSNDENFRKYMSNRAKGLFGMASSIKTNSNAEQTHPVMSGEFARAIQGTLVNATSDRYFVLSLIITGKTSADSSLSKLSSSMLSSYLQGHGMGCLMTVSRLLSFSGFPEIAESPHLRADVVKVSTFIQANSCVEKHPYFDGVMRLKSDSLVPYFGILKKDLREVSWKGIPNLGYVAYRWNYRVNQPWRENFSGKASFHRSLTDDLKAHLDAVLDKHLLLASNGDLKDEVEERARLMIEESKL
eukprot:GHVN01103568.1.p1 GENE.GHVN01103568.1~~GHVN01103568.1.p1  ORF type:complete len:296 (+),score=25.41 GHVN01103568.1:430-1317(+)